MMESYTAIKKNDGGEIYWHSKISRTKVEENLWNSSYSMTYLWIINLK